MNTIVCSIKGYVSSPEQIFLEKVHYRWLRIHTVQRIHGLILYAPGLSVKITTKPLPAVGASNFARNLKTTLMGDIDWLKLAGSFIYHHIVCLHAFRNICGRRRIAGGLRFSERYRWGDSSPLASILIQVNLIRVAPIYHFLHAGRFDFICIYNCISLPSQTHASLRRKRTCAAEHVLAVVSCWQISW